MSRRIDPLDQPACFSSPGLSAASHWLDHLPFAICTVVVLRSPVTGERGTSRGTSHLRSFQPNQTLATGTRLFALDTWNGDAVGRVNHLELLQSPMRPHHFPCGDFSTLLPLNLTESPSRFGDGKVALLRIEGFHTYEAVRHDFATRRRKPMKRRVLLVRDVADRTLNSVLYRSWDESRASFSAVDFNQDRLLGVLTVGCQPPDDLRVRFSAGGLEAVGLSSLIEELGRRVWPEMNGANLCAVEPEPRRILFDSRLNDREEANQRTRVAEEGARGGLEQARLAREQAEHDRVCRLSSDRECPVLRAQINRVEQEQAVRKRSLSWRLADRVARVGRAIAPPTTARRRFVRQAAKLVEVTRREGYSAVPTRLLKRAGRRLIASFPRRSRPVPTWTADERPVFLLVHHGGGGGIGRHVDDLGKQLRDAGVRPVTLSPSAGGSLQWKESDPGGAKTWGLVAGADRDSITSAIRLINPAHVHIHSLMALPEELLRVLSERGLTYDWTIHDYYPFCPRAHLDRDDGRYCGEPDDSGCAACLDRLGDYRGRRVDVSIREWRRQNGSHLRGARRVFAPSEDVRRRVDSYIPGIPVVVRPHLEAPVRPVQNAPLYASNSTLRVAVVGTLTTLKGSGLVESCADDARRNTRPIEFVVFGRTDRDAALARTRRVVLTGPYREDEVYARLKSSGCHLALLPSVVPETHMYTLSIVIRAGLLPVCLDLGAQAERLRSLGIGLVLPLGASPATINESLIRAAAARAVAPASQAPEPCVECGDLLGSYYGFTDDERERLGLPARVPSSSTAIGRHAGENVHACLH